MSISRVITVAGRDVDAAIEAASSEPVHLDGFGLRRPLETAVAERGLDVSHGCDHGTELVRLERERMVGTLHRRGSA